VAVLRQSCWKRTFGNGWLGSSRLGLVVGGLDVPPTGLQHDEARLAISGDDLRAGSTA
jgi:hypothetical protein